MNSKSRIPLLNTAFPRFHAAAVFLILCYYLICPMVPEHWASVYSVYGRVLIIAVAAVYFYTCRLSGCLEVRLVIFYAAWVFITRVLNTDYYLDNELDLVISRILCSVVLPAGLLISSDDREKLLDILAAVMGTFWFFTCILGLYAYITGNYFYVGPEAQVFGIDAPDYFNHLVLWQTNRTIFSVWVYIAWCLMIYEFFRCRNKLWRIPIIIAFVVFHLSIAVGFSRTIKLVSALNIGMLAIILVIDAMLSRKAKVRVLFAAAAFLITAPFVFKSYDWIVSGMGYATEIAGLDENRPSDEYIAYRNKDDHYSDPRQYNDAISGAVSRSQIYESFLPTIKRDPSQILIGKYTSKIMDIPHEYMEYPFTHMHNYLLQTFMLTGIIGFLAVAAFSVLLVLKMLRLFFSSAPVKIKCLTFPLTGILINNMFDLYLFSYSPDYRSMGTDIRELCFMLLAGITLAYASQYTYPLLGKSKKLIL